MLRTFAIFMGLVFMLGCGVAIAAWPQDRSAQNAQFTELQFRAGYVRIRAGVTPVSQLAGAGL